MFFSLCMLPATSCTDVLSVNPCNHSGMEMNGDQLHFCR